MAPDPLEFEPLYAALHPRIVRYLARLAGPGEAEDLAQEVFAKVYQSLSAFRGDAQVSTWIYRIATNAALDRLRSPSYKTAATSVLPEAACAEPAPVSIEQGVIRKEMAGCVERLVSSLPPGYRTVVVLSDMEGLKKAEIAEILGITVGNVKIRLHRGRRLLKASLESQCRFYRDQRNALLCDLKPGLPKP